MVQGVTKWSFQKGWTNADASPWREVQQSEVRADPGECIAEEFPVFNKERALFCKTGDLETMWWW